MPPRAPAEHERGELHLAFRAAFADYLVPGLGDIERDAFDALLQSRGWVPEASRVETDPEGKIIAFWLSGLDERDGKTRAYDIATGVHPAYRRHGFGSRLWGEVRANLVSRGVSSCQLEVLAGNTKAVELYRSLGFERSREFDCYRRASPRRLPDSPSADPPLVVEAAPLDETSLKSSRSWWDWVPSWQHSESALRRAGSDTVWFTARSGGELVGYAALLASAKDLAQLAVAPSFRRIGVGRQLLQAALEYEAQLRVLNVDSVDLATRRLLEAQGFESYAPQYEMRVAL